MRTYIVSCWELTGGANGIVEPNLLAQLDLQRTGWSFANFGFSSEKSNDLLARAISDASGSANSKAESSGDGMTYGKGFIWELLQKVQ